MGNKTKTYHIDRFERYHARLGEEIEIDEGMKCADEANIEIEKEVEDDTTSLGSDIEPFLEEKDDSGNEISFSNVQEREKSIIRGTRMIGASKNIE